jgi:hypothetical protein
VKRRRRAGQGFRAFHSAWRTLQGIETMNMIRKGQMRWLPKDEVAGEAVFIGWLFVLTGPSSLKQQAHLHGPPFEKRNTSVCPRIVVV